ncbi:TRAP-type mannitol/chloroaromatic compound transport system, small permease component [Jannaschia faecimaris]|uniref:TRAP transporter small permease protein n=1 Tax=Jannaschia faecimaris TaxID=1244108 RepID=A0A1H3NMG9_9RHOB|nr:TRAP transporter small permease [Jannaschia faecimaris]SDY89409.1 TRAP-type mannitol/chloroaromatic compound transport system, small permease component [Jannaschia faecimaris]
MTEIRPATPVETAADAGPMVYKPDAIEVIVPLLFVVTMAWTTWHFPGFLILLREPGPELDRLAREWPLLGPIDWLMALASFVLLVVGIKTVKRAPMEWQDWGLFDRVSCFLGRVVMTIIALMVCVMLYEVLLRYAFEKPTLWANEVTLWLAGFTFLLSGLYAMQQRSHIRIYLLYDLMPRGIQRTCDVISTALIVTFAFFLVYGGYGEAVAKFLRWELYGTAFNPPLPATIKPMILLVIVLVAVQAVANLFRDWNLEPVIHTAADDIDQDELERLRRAVGSND